MSAVVGIDLSTHALDLVKLSEDSNAATWTRCELRGKSAWERTLDIRNYGWFYLSEDHSYWDDVYLVAIEAPYGRGKVGTTAVLNRVVGAVVASLPTALRVPERCWIVRPDEWKTGLGLKGKPTQHDLLRIVGDPFPFTSSPRLMGPTFHEPTPAEVQNARDAYCLAYWARETNARAVAQALEVAT